MHRRKIRIAQVITRLDRGGSPDIYRVLSSRLDPKIYDITLIMGPTDYPSRKTEEFLEKFRGRTIVISSLKRDIDPVADMAAFVRLFAIFRKHRFDIVHTHTAKAGALGRLAAGLAGIPVVVHTPHGHHLYGYFSPRMSRLIMRIETFLARFTDRIIALTELEKSDYIKFGIAKPNNVVMIYQGLELDLHRHDWKEIFELKAGLNLRPEDNIIGMVGRLEPVKGSGLFIEAAYAIAKRFPAVKFLIVGEGSLRKSMEERSRALGITDKLIFTGWREDVPAMLSLMDVMVLPSLNEAVGIALIEAQAQGVPVVASKVGGIPEVVRDGKTGILIQPSDPGMIAEAVTALLVDKKKRDEMGRAGKAWVQDKFKAAEMTEKISALYLELLNMKKCFIA